MSDLKYIDGNPILVNAIQQLNEAKAGGAPVDEQIAHYQSVLDADIQLRTRVVGAVAVADSLIDAVIGMGTAVEAVNGGQAHIPAGMNRAPQDLVNDISGQITAYADEVAPATDLAKNILDMLAPLLHRMALAESAMLKTRMWYTLNVSRLTNHSASTISDVVTDMEQITNGSWPSYMARMQGCSEPEWNFAKLESLPMDDLTIRKLMVWADGAIHPVSVCAYVDVENIGNGYMPIHDPSIIQVVTEKSLLVPVHAIGCWREATEEEVNSDAFKVSEEILKNSVTAYTGVVAQAKAQEEAMKAQAAAEQSGLILPEGAKGDAPKLILPN